MPQDTMEDVGIGSVTVSINDQRNISYSADPVEPDVNGNISFNLVSTGSKVWTFNSNDPINIANPHDFSYTLVSPTQLNVTDTSADEATIPQHNYTLKIQSQNGENFEFDPVIRDRV
ncbi:hypothetical protein [Sphingomonas arenae]|uniref:hypothetical protein n=1 Tax=Sphingomonas arenae TaxID=2812555 RepID=UPI001967E78E|nr:hypothetical protein [Sphingomonas arenae]